MGKKQIYKDEKKMLVLKRSSYGQEQIMIGDDIKITVIGVKGNQVQVGVDAPKSIKVHRLEIYNKIHGIVEDDDSRGNS